MSANLPSPDRRKVLAASVTLAASSLIPTQAYAATTSDGIRPFRVDIPREQLADLRRRIAATRHIASWDVQICEACIRGNSDGIPLELHPRLAEQLQERGIWATKNSKGLVDIPTN